MSDLQHTQAGSEFPAADTAPAGGTAVLTRPVGMTEEDYGQLPIVMRGTWAPEGSDETAPFGPFYRGENGRVCQKVKKTTMDLVCAWGAPGNLARIQALTDAQLVSGLAWAGRHTPVAGVQAVMPARAQSQKDAYIKYVKALRAFEDAVRAEQAARLVATAPF